MNHLKNHLLSKVKSMYNNSDLSDGIMNIIEDEIFIYNNIPNPNEDESNVVKKKMKVQSPQKKCFENNKQTNIVNRKLFCSIPIHCFVLSIQSDYFKNLMYNSNMKESKTKVFNIKVGEGEGMYMKYLLQSFYDTDIFNEMECYSLVRVLELADRYSCDAIMNEIEILSKSIKLSSIEECQNIANRINSIKCGLEISFETQKKILNECGVFAAKYFCPLENQSLENHKLFQQVSFDLLVPMLRCKQPIAWHENSVLYYIELWLKFDKARQTKDNIKSLLKATNYFCIDCDFLMESVTRKHEIFRKWNQYIDWFIHAVAHHGSSRKRPYLSIFNFFFQRNFKDNTIDQKYTFLMEIDDEGIFYPKENYFVYKGYPMSLVVRFSLSCPNEVFQDIYFSFACENFIDRSGELDHLFLTLDFNGTFRYSKNCVSPDNQNSVLAVNEFILNKTLSFSCCEEDEYHIGKIKKKIADGLKEFILIILIP